MRNRFEVQLPLTRFAAMATCEGAGEAAPAAAKAGEVDRSHYDVLNSPFLEIRTPFTKWCDPILA